MINFIFMCVFLSGVSLFNIVGKLKMHCNVSEPDFFLQTEQWDTMKMDSI